MDRMFDVWKDVPRELVSLGVCVSGCCGGVIPGSLVLPGWSEVEFQKLG